MKAMFGFCDACSRSFPGAYETCIHCGAKLRLEKIVDSHDTSPSPDTRKIDTEPLELGSDEKAKYPFLVESQAEASVLKIEELTDEIVAKATSRLEGAIAGLVDHELSDNHKKELLVFVAQLLMVKLAGVDALVRRFALSESKRVEYFMLWDLKGDRSLARKFAKDVLEAEFSIATREAKVKPKSEDKKRASAESSRSTMLAIPVVEYLMHVTTLRSKEWALKARNVESGMVFLRDKEVARLVRHELQVRLITRVRRMSIPDRTTLPEGLLMAAESIRAKYIAKFEHGTMTLPSVLPPCVRRIIEMLERHENVSHAGRILLATYMAANGRPSDEICALFRGAPDYDEATTRKNVEYLAGKNAVGRAYHVKRCERVKAEGFCFPDDGCKSVTHPLQYGRETRTN